MKVGVFDSGKGGQSVATAIEKALPEAEVIFVNDSQHVPYGLRSPDEIYGYVKPIFTDLVNQGCQVIVVACNTVSTTLINKLRDDFDLPLIAMEPMVRPAAQLTETGKVAVCATPTTLASQRYAWLKLTYASGVEVVEPDCSDWSYLIEHNKMNEQIIKQRIDPVIKGGADVIVLGCTHYHWIEAQVRQIVAGKATVLQPEQPVITQLKRVLGI